MYGYVIPDKLNMFMKDFYRYKAFYCGMCKCIGKENGQLMRFGTSYDITFLNIFAHGVLGVEPDFNNEVCVLNPIKKKTIAKSTPLMVKINLVNVLLLYYKLIDDECDKNKRLVSKLFVEKHYKAAKSMCLELDNVFKEEYAKLRQLELEKCSSIDLLAHPFGEMMRAVIKFVLGDAYTDVIGELLYNIGRFIYIMDAIDDVQDDFADKTFNPYLVDYNFVDRQTFNKEKGAELEFLLTHLYNRIKESYKFVTMITNEGVVTNILWYGILERMNAVLSAESKLSLPKV